jgi:hypothetical protein
MVTLVVGVYAVILSNTLTTSWTLKAGTPLNLYWAAPYWYPSAELNRGEWIYATIGLKNTGLATYDLVSPKFKIWTDASGLPTNCIKIEYWDGDSWEDMTGVITGWGSATLYGYFGPSTGFPVDPPYDEVTSFRIMFDGDAPLVGYGFEAWVVQV